MNAAADISGPAPSGQNKPFGKVERLISRRYLGAKKKDGGVGLIAGLSFFCIMLAVAAMIIIMSIMNGFRDRLIELTIGSQGHMYVASAAPQPSPESVRDLERKLSAVPGIEKAFEMSEDQTMVQRDGKISGVVVNGISPESLRGFDLIVQNLVLGSLDDFGEGRGSRVDPNPKDI